MATTNLTTRVRLFRACTFGLWAVQFGFLLGSIAYWAFSTPASNNPKAVPSASLIILLPGLTLETVLILKTASYTPYLSSHMQWFDTSFDESTLALEILQLIWLTATIVVSRAVYMDVVVQGGPIRDIISFLRQHPPLTDSALAPRICLVYFLLSYASLVIWVWWTGFAAMVRRSIRPVQVREKEASVALTSSPAPDDKDNHGN
ncbi:uncharacterized protein NECHADRAFT_75449 [Fusarium vanettenii 77-13-4]|uniref:Uncharacterized protein n=1 Tax=Fusarium vanettenii (strain ATCC MYA-4622 / CBS 123669 / FGSC 9596 / NRRL 45880 / 77-13-4) TaxID=660122 RepID=C7YIU8_FUSV7|nr:uncharacterized protein NECHADRAFT_75449 [Fusarium vanettenii 77-13-4]EEU48868.1 predicted protein [Fusarium vanettenii 77-13-4]